MKSIRLNFRNKLIVVASAMVIIPLIAVGIITQSGFISSINSIIAKDLGPVARIGVRMVEANHESGQGISHLEGDLLSIKLGETGYIYVMNSEGTLIVHPSKKGKNVFSYDFAKEIVQKAHALNENEVGVVRYDWVNKEAGESEAREKIAVFTYFKPLDYIVVAGSYTGEFTDEAVSSNLRTLVIVSVTSIVIAVIFVALFSKRFSTPITELNAVAISMAEGDLTKQVNVTLNDEIGELGMAFNKMIKDLRETIMRVGEASAAVASATTQISSSTEEMAAGSQEQSSQASEVASAVEEMTKTIIENSRNASDAADTAKHAKQAAEAGGQVVRDTVEGMKRIADVVNKSAETVRALGNSSDQIGEIIEVIDDIADQTNLLALNAAIEAARAGEQGRGFAVVADEVRKLAERTTKATKEIATMIKQIQADTKGAVVSMEEGTKEVASGIDLADKAGKSLHQLETISQEVTDKVTQIAAASEQQSTASEQISKNVEGISTVTQETASATQQIARTAEDLNRLTENLQQLIERFQLGEEKNEQRYTVKKSSLLVNQNGSLQRSSAFDFEAAKNAHKMWRMRVQKLLMGRESIEEKDLVSHRDCKLGKWYYNDGNRTCGHVDSFVKLGIEHEKMHNLVKEVVHYYNQGKIEQAQQSAEKVYDYSNHVISLLNELEKKCALQHQAV